MPVRLRISSNTRGPRGGFVLAARACNSLIRHAIPVKLGRPCLTRIGHSAPGIWNLGSLIEGLAHGHRGGLRLSRWAASYRLAVVLTLAAAPRRVARCGARCPASAPAPSITPPAPAGERPVPVCTARPGVPPTRTLLRRPAVGDGQALIPRRAGHSGLSGGGRRGVRAFSRRPSAAVRRRRTGSILAVSVVPRRGKAPHRDARIAIPATAARCRRRRRWPAACRRD
jgi:hypothetical protein